MIPGRTLELGAGTGNFKENVPQIITSDIVYVPWLDIVMYAHTLPFKNNSFDNIMLFDVLHHLENPVFFLMKHSGFYNRVDASFSWNLMFHWCHL